VELDFSTVLCEVNEAYSCLTLMSTVNVGDVNGGNPINDLGVNSNVRPKVD
jgi:hypothetical protein